MEGERSIDKTNVEYKLGFTPVNINKEEGENEYVGEIKIAPNRSTTFWNRNLNDLKKDIQKSLFEYFEEENVKYLYKSVEMQELALRIKENGLEATSQYYQTLAKNNEGGNK